jgi:hypothetical protein
MRTPVVAEFAGRYAELVLVLGLSGLRWGELAGLQVGDLVHVHVPGRASACNTRCWRVVPVVR